MRYISESVEAALFEEKKCVPFALLEHLLLQLLNFGSILRAVESQQLVDLLVQADSDCHVDVHFFRRGFIQVLLVDEQRPLADPLALLKIASEIR